MQFLTILLVAMLIFALMALAGLLSFNFSDFTVGGS